MDKDRMEAVAWQMGMVKAIANDINKKLLISKQLESELIRFGIQKKAKTWTEGTFICVSCPFCLSRIEVSGCITNTPISPRSCRCGAIIGEFCFPDSPIVLQTTIGKTKRIIKEIILLKEKIRKRNRLIKSLRKRT